MFIAILSTTGEDEGYLELDRWDSFKSETDPDEPTSKNLVVKRNTTTKVYHISDRSYNALMEYITRYSL